ncbi:MAG: HEPN domain-containing protein [bacterium]|nr:HEPN domain-containing protein [bacterium]
MRRDDYRLRSESAGEWLAYARKDLALARLGERDENELSHQVCFLAQQAAEKAIKAVMIFRRIPFPFVHDIEVLLRLVSDEKIDIPADVLEAEELTPYAVEARYPGLNGPIPTKEVTRAVEIAYAVIRWAERLVGEAAEGGAV